VAVREVLPIPLASKFKCESQADNPSACTLTFGFIMLALNQINPDICNYILVASFE